MNDQTAAVKKNSLILIIKRHMLLVISIIISLLVALIITVAIKHKQNSNNIETSEQFNKARILIVNQKFIEGKKILNEIIKKNNKFYSPLSLYLIIENDLEKNPKIITQLFDEILLIKKIEKENLDLIRIKKAIFLANFDSENEIEKTLEPIIESNSICREKAISLLADYFLSKQKKKKADQYYNLLKSKNNK